jgi:hypothetical protein
MRPVWHFSLERTTNAPFETVKGSLKDGAGFHRWHPRHREAVLEVVREDACQLELRHESTPIWGVSEQDRYWVSTEPDGLLLVYEARFKGWPVLLLMGWWRVISHRLWERFVAQLG